MEYLWLELVTIGKNGSQCQQAGEGNVNGDALNSSALHSNFVGSGPNVFAKLCCYWCDGFYVIWKWDCIGEIEGLFGS